LHLSRTPADRIAVAAAAAASIISRDNGTSGGTVHQANRQSCHLKFSIFVLEQKKRKTKKKEIF